VQGGAPSAKREIWGGTGAQGQVYWRAPAKRKKPVTSIITLGRSAQEVLYAMGGAMGET